MKKLLLYLLLFASVVTGCTKQIVTTTECTRAHLTGLVSSEFNYPVNYDYCSVSRLYDPGGMATWKWHYAEYFIEGSMVLIFPKKRPSKN